jgi:YD repeat-containing protein
MTKGSEHGDSNAKSSPEEKAMKDTYNLPEFGSFRRVLRGAALLACLAANAAALRAAPGAPQSCQLGVNSMTLDKSSVIAWTTPPTGLATATITLNCPYGGPANAQVLYVLYYLNGVWAGGTSAVACPQWGTTCTAQLTFDQVPTTTVYTVTASLWPTKSSVSLPITVVPLTVSATLTPSTVVGGGSLQPTLSVTTNAPVSEYIPGIIGPGGVLPVGVSIPCYDEIMDIEVPAGTKTGSRTVATLPASKVTRCPMTVGIGVGPTTSVLLTVIPAPGNAVNPAGVGPTSCPLSCGNPVNISNGNVWIRQRDFSVPGLGGGLDLTRTWNSLRDLAGPPDSPGMFGLGWQSTYEEQLLLVDSQTLQYWRSDGGAWTFTYNSTLNSYSLASPPDVRAQLVQNPATGTFTITLADGTQRLFNAQNQLAAIIDRNGNQTTLAYDSSYRLASVTSPGGSTLTFSYNDPNNLMQATSAQDAVGTVATYSYDSVSRLTNVTYPDGSALNFTFDANLNIATVTDNQGKLIESHTYDAQGRGLTSTRAYGVDSVSLTY